MEKDVSVINRGSLRKEPLKKQLSFDEKVTEIRLMELTNNDMRYEDLINQGKSLQWWSPSDDNTFANFCKATSIHGLRYIGTEGMHFLERVLWTIVFVISGIGAIVLIKALFDNYYTRPVVVTLDPEELFIGKVPFPAVTICNMNRVLKSKAEEYIRVASEDNETDIRVQTARQNVYYLNHVCSVSNKPFSQLFNYSMEKPFVDPELLAKVKITKEEEDIEDVRNFLKEASQPCDDMIKLCMWEEDALNCATAFKTVETTFGKCCVFNMIPSSILKYYTNENYSKDAEEILKDWKISADVNVEDFLTNKYDFPRHQKKAGKATGLMVLADPALDEYFCTSSDSAGFRLRLHFPTDIPHVNDFGIAIRPNYEHFISVTPSVTVAEEVIKSYPVEKRKCYFEGEKPLKYYKIYSTSNCMDECVANQTFADCNCVRYYMPRDETRDICRPTSFSCADNSIKNIFKVGVKNACDQCLPTCSEVKYSASMSTAPLHSLNVWYKDNQSAPWANKEVSIINIYFGEESIHPKHRHQKYDIAELIAGTGGILGLFMGFSLLSLFEVIFHLTCRPWCHKKERNTNGTDIESKYPASKSANGQNGSVNNGFHQDILVEARRVHMKPGDDGLYHLQKTTTRTPTPPLYTESSIPEEDDSVEIDDTMLTLEEPSNSLNINETTPKEEASNSVNINDTAPKTEASNSVNTNETTPKEEASNSVSTNETTPKKESDNNSASANIDETILQEEGDNSESAETENSHL